MSAEDKQIPQRWGFRRNDNSADSSSDDQSRPSSASEPKHKKHNLGENYSSHDVANKELNKSCKKQERNSRARKADRKAFDNEPSNGTLICLRGHMESLVEGVKVAREDLLKWMNNEMEKSFKDDKISDPPQLKKGQRRGSKETEKADTKCGTPRSNPIKQRPRRSGKVTKNLEDGSSAKLALETKPPHESSEVVIPLNEPAENADGGTTPVEKSVNQRVKRKRLGPSAKTQKNSVGNQQPDNHLTLPKVMPSREDANKEKINSESGNGLINLSSQNCTPRFENRNDIFTQSGMRNFGDYEQNRVGNIQLRGNSITNGTGSVFPFAIPSQGLNCGFSIPNFPTPFGLQYLSHEGIIPGLRMNHGFGESYGAYNQQLRMNGQGGLMPLHPPDNIRAENQQPR